MDLCDVATVIAAMHPIRVEAAVETKNRHGLPGSDVDLVYTDVRALSRLFFPSPLFCM